MLETLVLLLQLCNTTQCNIVREENMDIITVCDIGAVDNTAWEYTKIFVDKTTKKTLVIRHSVCSGI